MSAGVSLFYYAVQARTWRREPERLMGYYGSRDLANRVSRFVSAYFSEKLRGDISVRVECLVRPPADPKIVVQKELGADEEERLRQLEFNVLPGRKRKAEKKEEPV